MTGPVLERLLANLQVDVRAARADAEDLVAATVALPERARLDELTASVDRLEKVLDELATILKRRAGGDPQ